MHTLAVTTINLCELSGCSVGFVVLPSLQCGDHNTNQFSSVNHKGSETLCMTGNPDYMQLTNENLEEKIRIEIICKRNWQQPNIWIKGLHFPFANLKQLFLLGKNIIKPHTLILSSCYLSYLAHIYFLCHSSL